MIDKIRQLNEAGKDKASDFINILSTHPDYKK